MQERTTRKRTQECSQQSVKINKEHDYEEKKLAMLLGSRSLTHAENISTPNMNSACTEFRIKLPT